MQNLEEVTAAKNELEPTLMNKPGVQAIEVGYTDPDQTEKGYCIRIIVSDKQITLADLDLSPHYKGVPLKLIVRKIELH
jgi:hypothetical protein